MNITDKEVQKKIKRLGMFELTESIESWSEEERDGRTDMEIFSHEVSHFYNLYCDGDTIFNEDLREAKEVLRRTKYGKVIPLWKDTLKPIYSENRIIQAKNTVNEFKRLKRLYNKICE